MYYPEGYLLHTTRNRAALADESSLRQAIASGQICEAHAVLCDTEHNLVVQLGCMRGLIPRCEGAIGIRAGSVRDIAVIARVNKPVCFRVVDILRDDCGKKYALLSRVAAQEACQCDYLAALRPGDIIDAKVTHLEPFGAFCDIGCGNTALLPIDAISVSRIAHPCDRLRCGDDLRVVVRGRDEAGRICLSHKELLGTWMENAAQFSPGQTLPGIVRSIEPYGVFVELAPNLAGLAEPCHGVRSGQQCSVFCKSLIPEKMKVKLVLIHAFDDACPLPPLRYFVYSDHITHWVYSPPACDRLVESVF